MARIPEPRTGESADQNGPTWRTDPLALLAEAAGYKDHELWWEQQIERRENAAGLFDAILEAMRTVREETGEPRARDLLREAHMRKILRGVVRERHERIAVVCGAWHAPVLDEAALCGQREGLTAKDDDARLKGLRQTQDLGHLDSLDLHAAGLSQRLRGGGRIARMVRPPLAVAPPDGDALDRDGRPAAPAKKTSTPPRPV